MRQILVAEAGGRCAICGYARCAWNLTFHHVDPTLKEIEMTMASGKALDTYRREAMLCANCHGEVEAGLVASPPVGAIYVG